MRVAIITPSWGEPWSEGVRNLARCLQEYLITNGDDVRIVHPEYGAGKRETARNSNILRYARSGGRFLLKARNILLSEPTDVAFWFTSLSSWYGIKQRILLSGGVPVVPFITGLQESVKGYGSFAGETPTLVITPYFQQRFFPSATFIPPFLPVTVKRPAGFTRQPPAPPYKVLFIGSFESARGLETLLKAISLLDQRFQMTIAWNGVGASRQKYIIGMIEQLNISSRVSMLREVNVSEEFCRADVLVIPRLKPVRMAFPVRILEAAHMRLPMIVSDLLGMREVVSQAGLSFPPGNADALAGALRDLLTDPARYDTAVSGCEIMEEKYSSDTYLKKVREVLRNAAAGR